LPIFPYYFGLEAVFFIRRRFRFVQVAQVLLFKRYNHIAYLRCKYNTFFLAIRKKANVFFLTASIRLFSQPFQVYRFPFSFQQLAHNRVARSVYCVVVCVDGFVEPFALFNICILIDNKP
jgi:hypothetical protein